MNKNSIPSWAPASATKRAASRVISTSPSPSVSTVSVAVAIASTTVAVTADIRVMVGRAIGRAPASRLLHEVFLQIGEHFDQAPPSLLDRRHHAIDVGMARQL